MKTSTIALLACTAAFSWTAFADDAAEAPSARADTPSAVATSLPSSPPLCGEEEAGCLILGQNTSYELEDSGSVEWVQVVEDSRCPIDAFCIWAGRVRIEFKHTSPDRDQKFVIGLGSGVMDHWIDPVSGLTLTLKEVWPLPSLTSLEEKVYQAKIIAEPRVRPDTQEESPVQESPVQDAIVL